MRFCSIFLFPWLVATLGCEQNHHEAEIIVRDESNAGSSTSSSSGSVSSTLTSQLTPSASETNSVRPSITSIPQNSSISTTSFTSGFPTVSTSSISSSVSAISTSLPQNHDALPIQPRITPALGIAGVALLISGLALCFIGIKHAWLHVFLSTSLLASLAVTVLVVYVMTPPVPDAIQGAYFVASFMTGIILGGLSLIFPEVTEGLSCLLGGFSVGMWFLVLRQGGLVRNQTGRGILIGTFCAIAWALAFSHHTRAHALIFCTAFAGSTAMMLGIDCFTRAGLKEFWIYIWNLNDNEFPLGTTSYPITRGVRVETACIVILSLFGLLSQLKIWKVVKKRRDRRKNDELRDSESWNRVEDLVGRQIQRNNERSLRQWEATYGNESTARGTANSDVRQSKYVSGIREQDLKAIDDKFLYFNQSRRASKTIGASSTTLVVSTPSDLQGTRCIDTIHETKTIASEISRSNSRASSRLVVHEQCVDASTEHLILGRGVTTTPGSVPPPNRISSRPASRVVSAIRRSIGDIQQSISPRSSHIATHDKMGSVMDSTLRQSMVSMEDDRASSLAATVDDLAYLTDLANHRLSTPLDFTSGQGGATPQRASFVEVPLDEPDEEVILHSKPEEPLDQRSEQARDASIGLDLDEKNLGEHINNRVSRVTTAFRTNEWAKHITEAQEPEQESVRCTSPGVHVDQFSNVPSDQTPSPGKLKVLKSANLQKHADSINTEYKSALITPNSKRLSGRDRASKRLSQSTVQQADVPSKSVQQKDSEASIATLPASEAGPMQSSMRASNSHLVRPVTSAAALSIPVTTHSHIVTSDEPDWPLHSSRADVIPARDSTSRSRSASGPRSRRQSSEVIPLTTMVPVPKLNRMSSSNTMSRADISRPASAHRPLSARRPTTPARSSMIYDSHQPMRERAVNADRQAALQTQWRRSLQNGAGVEMHVPTGYDPVHATMLYEQRQLEWFRQQEQTEKANRQSVIDLAMRSGQMNEAHRDALRKMQARTRQEPGA